MKSFWLFLALWISTVSAHAVAIDQSLVQGSADTYSGLLNKLGKEAKKDDDTALQQALLNKLITLSKARKVQPIQPKIPSDAKAFRQLFRDYQTWLLSRSHTQSLIDDLTNKMSAVSIQLKNSKPENSSTRSLQLQYAFYSKGKQQAERKLGIYTNAIEMAKPIFIDAVKKISFQNALSKGKISKIEASISSLDKAIQNDQVERERLTLLERTRGIKKLDDSINNSKSRKKKLLADEIEELFMELSDALHNKDAPAAFSIQDKISQILTTAYQADVIRGIHSLINDMDIATLGRAATLKSVAIGEVKDSISNFWEILNAPLLTINEVPVSALKLIIVLFVLIVGFMAGGIYKRYVNRISFKSRSFTSSTRTLVANLGNYLIISIAFFISLNIIGINLSSIALVAGALSVGIGFGLQNIVSNFVSGIILLFERSIKIGDYLEIDDKLRGRVTDIRMRSTTIATNANIDVIIPNQDLIQNKVINWTMNDQIRRYEIPFGVAYGTQPQKVIDAVLSAVGHSGFTDLYTNPPRQVPSVIMTGMGDSSVDFLLLVWLKGRKTLSPKRTTSRFLILIYNALNASGIEIPFPQRDLHLRSIDGTIPVQQTQDNDSVDENKATDVNQQ